MARYNKTPLDGRYFDDVDTYFTGFNNRLRPDQLKPGVLAMSINGRMGVDGAWQPRKGAQYFGPLLGTSASALTIPWYLYASKTVFSAARVNTLVTVVTTANHGFVNLTQVGLAGLTGTVDPNGNRTITVTALDTFTFVIAGATGSETYAGSGTVGAPFISSAVNAAYGSCRFSDPSNSNAEYIILATNDKAKAVNLITEVVTDIAYPTGITITAACEMVQAFGKVYIFRNGLTTLSWNGTLSGTPAFAKVANGAYTQPLVLTTANNAACTAGVVTITNTHNLAVGDTVTIFDEGTTGLVRFDKYQVASISTTTAFTFYASVDDFTATSVVLGVRQSNGRGYSHMPAPAWGVYHQRRMIVPFAYTTSGTSGSETITARNISDEIVFSDILDSDTYDLLQDQFRVTGGIADYLKTVHPFTEDAAVAFNRNSVHLMTGLSGDVTDLSIKLITAESGCVARKSVVTIGNSVFFLSDNGIYSMEFGDLYNLRGAKLPVSDAIDPLIKRINSDYAHRAVAIFHDNRYYLAVPLDSSVTNNAILVFNALNKEWESLDIIEQNGWDVTNFIVASPLGINQLYAINSYGGINILENRMDDRDNIYTYPGVAATSFFIDSSATSRQFTLGTSERKKFNTYELHVESSDTNDSNADINGVFENIDKTVSINTITGILGTLLAMNEDASIRGRMGNIRSYGAQLEFAPSAGRPKLRMVKVTGLPTFTATTQAT